MGATVCSLLRDSAGVWCPESMGRVGGVAMGVYRSVGESTLLDARLLSLKVANSSAALTNSSDTPNTGEEEERGMRELYQCVRVTWDTSE